MKIYLFLFVLLLSCSTINQDNILKKDMEFSEKLSMEDFKIKLKVYSKKSEYPNIDN